MRSTEALPEVELAVGPTHVSRPQRRRSLFAAAAIALALTAGIAVRAVDSDGTPVVKPAPASTVPGLQDNVAVHSWTPMVTATPAEPAFSGGMGD